MVHHVTCYSDGAHVALLQYGSAWGGHPADHIFSQFHAIFGKQINFHVLARGGSRTSPRRGRQPNILVIFSEESYEIKEILVCRWGTCRVRPPRSATVGGSRRVTMPLAEDQDLRTKYC